MMLLARHQLGTRASNVLVDDISPSCFIGVRLLGRHLLTSPEGHEA